MGLRTPDQQTVFDRCHCPVDGDDKEREHDHAGKNACHVEHAFGLVDEIAEARGRTQIFADDGADTGSGQSAPVTVVNAAPVISSVSLTPTAPVEGDTLSCTASAPGCAASAVQCRL